MHYVICYDLESDRLRLRTAALLERHGCQRVQKSVFVAPNLLRKDWANLKTALNQLPHNPEWKPQDSIYALPLPDDMAGKIRVWGENKTITDALEKKLKIIL